MATQLKKLPISLNYEELIPYINKANYSLGKLDGLFRIIPNPRLLISPLAAKEATLSSKIEGTQSSLPDMYKFESGEETKYQDVLEIVNYRKALYLGIDELGKTELDLGVLKKLHYILMSGVRGEDQFKGEFRTIQNWISKKGHPIEKAIYIPPVAEKLMDYLKNFEDYLNYEEKDPLVQAGILHYQFEAIHPFIDGNGRIGRLVIPLFLYKKGLLSYPILYISEYLEENRDKYYDLLKQVTEKGEYTEWIKFFLIAVQEQSEKTQKTILKTMKLYEETKALVSSVRSQYSLGLVDLIFRMPVVSRTQIQDNLNVNRTTVLRLVNLFTELGIIKEIQDRKRNKIYSFDKLFKILND